MSRRGVVSVVAAASAVMAALVVAATGPGTDLLSRPRDTVVASLDPRSLTFTRRTTSTPLLTPTAPPGTTGPEIILGALLQVLVVLLVATAAVLLVAGVRALLRRTTPHVESHAEAGFAVPPVPEELLANAELRIEALLTGSPRNAIVAAWMSLETDAAQAGLPRFAFETSAEYTERVLQAWAVAPEQIRQLAALYREARFSRHEITEEQRQQAVTALRVLHDDLARAAAAGVGGDTA